jgi:cyclopropane-fatty-acyl-phospholipid synthase
MNGEWVTDNLTALIRFFINANPEDKPPSLLTRLWHHINVRSHRKKANSKENAKTNITSHYDLNNDFFKLFLDPSMMYSSAFFKSNDDTLEKAQEQKMASLISRLQVSSGDTVLEIGSGWGALAIAIAKQTGAKVHTITLSNEQYDYVQETIKSEKLEPLITVSICDYRAIRTQYDAIVSVEMIEAVGHRYLKTYFNAVAQALKPSGRFVLQSITIPNNRYNTYRKNCDFIQKHIFPGGHLPSPGIIDSLSKSATLTQNHYLELGQSYAKTLSHWKIRLLAQKEDVLSLGFSDQFIRKFEYYFSYCEAAFLEKFIHVGQYQFIKNEES